MRLKEISREEFNSLLDSKKLLCNEEFPRKFAFLQTESNATLLALCWQSELVKPQIINNDQSSLFWFGVDQQLLAINKLNGKIILALTLPTNVCDLLIVKDSIVLRTESELYSFSLSGTIQMIYNFPEISESIEVNSNAVKVTLIDGQILSLNV
jgi:hypothetical protein